MYASVTSCERRQPEHNSRQAKTTRPSFWSMALKATALLVLCCFSILQSQTADSGKDDSATFRSKVQVVLLDVVVMDKAGQPIKDIPSDSFEVLEEGKPQTIASFEEHRGDPSSTSLLERPALPAHFYTNAPTSEPPGAINVLLLDALNTEPGDQSDVRRQMIQYLKTADPGSHIAIFGLGEKLRMLEGFTDDPKVLLSVLENKKSGAGPHAPMGPTAIESNTEQQLANAMAAPISTGTPGGPVSAAPPGMVEQLQAFFAEIQGTEKVSTISLTLQGLRELSRYLSGFHGRKNVIWFSGSFPPILFPSGGDRTRVDLSGTGLDQEMRQTINMLAAAQIAVYPVAAEGLQPQALFQAQSLAPPGTPGEDLRERMSTGQNQVLQDESVARYTNQKAAGDIASNTGGQAFYNTNDLKEAMAEVVRKGTYYYRISYSPTDKRIEGRYRHIQVKVKKGPYANPSTVSYRRGYYEEDANQKKAATTTAEPDLLQPLMKPGLPEATELIYNMRLLRAATEPPIGSPLIGDNRNVQRPVTRIGADFVVPLDNLEFDTTPDGVRHGKIEIALVAYDHAGTPLNWVFRSFNTTIKPELYSAIKTNGAQFHEDIDVPDGENFLRAGIYDLVSEKAGTFRIDLKQVTALENLPANASNAATSQEFIARNSGPPPPVAANGGRPSPSSGSSTFKLMPQDDVNLAAWRAFGSAPTADQLNQLLPADVPGYCLTLAGSGEHSPALEQVCEFAFSVMKKLPDVICNRDTRRYRNGRHRAEKMLDNVARGLPPDKKYFDLVNARVAYLNGHEYYSDVRINGVLSDPGTPLRSATWTVGEFSSILYSIFLPASKPELHFENEELLHSVPALVFDYHVSAQNNKTYALATSDKVWLPEYSGKIWVDKTNFRLLRLERETPYTPAYPISRVRIEVDYSNVGLGDGTSLILPSASSSLVCSPDYCGVNITAFADWRKFRATTNLVFDPKN